MQTTKETIAMPPEAMASRNLDTKNAVRKGLKAEANPAMVCIAIAMNSSFRRPNLSAITPNTMFPSSTPNIRVT